MCWPPSRCGWRPRVEDLEGVMSKKASLRDAFVRSVPSQLAVEPAEQITVDTAGSIDIYTASQEPVAAPEAPAPHTATQPPGQTPLQLPASTAVVASPSIQTSSYTASPLPVQRLIPKKKATFNLDASLHQRLKVAAAVHSREMVDIVEDALLKYLPNLDHSSNQGIAR